VVSFTPQPLYLLGKGPQDPSDRRLRGPQDHPGAVAETKNPITAPARK